MIHVGLTGNIATGKSYAATHFEKLGAQVIDADRVVHELLECGTPTYSKIVESFGEGILREDKSIERSLLAKIVFFDEDKRRQLNGITHPAVKEEIHRRIASFDQTRPGEILIVDAALMVETGGYREYDRLIVVACDRSLQLARLMRRDGLTENEALARMTSQMPIEEKIKLADYVIVTSGTLKQTDSQVEAIYRELLTHSLKKQRPKF
jgi:dephospho-CoA kinase